ncbi:glycine--tRNA ligase subunit beta [Fundidesulfovibrio butyratiphilus]
MPSFLLEIGFEEMPSRFLAPLAEELTRLIDSGLEQERLSHGAVRALATPRRLTALVEDLAEVQPRQEETLTGPPVRAAYDSSGNPTSAALGFAKGQGVSLESLFTIDTPKGQYLAVKKQSGGAGAMDILPGVCLAAIKGLSFPKKMRWGSLDVTFGRPVRWIVALLNDRVVPFEFARVASDRLTRGHRVMGPGPFAVSDPASYFDVLRDQAKVVLDPAARREAVLTQCAEATGRVGGKPIIGERLLEEVCGLVEYPLVVMGNFDKRYLELPREVLLTSMETHQKSFGVEDASGRLMAHFLTTVGLIPKDVALVRKGWERVLKARLEDARFFWETDLAQDFDAWLAKLENVIFLAPLGSMGAKTRRITALCDVLSGRVKPEITLDLRQAGRLCKADLVSEMVGEFSDLQGIMGGIYARRKGETEQVAQAVYEHYLPLGPESPVPASLAGALLAIADKFDTLAGCFGLDMIPTGAADPYALRRQALGVCRIIVEHGLRLDLAELAERALAGYQGVSWKLDPAEAKARLLEFFGSRLRAWYLGKGERPQVVDAALGAGFADVWALDARLSALSRFSKREDFDQAVLAFKRAANIIRKQGDGQTLSGDFDKSQLTEEGEIKLDAALDANAARFEALWGASDFDGLFGLLGEIRPAVDAFFDSVMVMCDDQTLRQNRLNLLKSLVDRLGRLADFGALQM